MNEHKPSSPTDQPTDHAHDDTVEQFDAAQQSLNDALRVSFFLLKVFMLVVALGYLVFGGMFRVSEQEAAVRLRFGKLVEEAPGQPRVYTSGWYFSWPYPIEQTIHIPTSLPSVTIAEPFMYRVAEGERGRPPSQLTPRPLNPEQDGMLVTGDANVVHARLTFSYRISDVRNFISHVGLAEPDEWLSDGTKARQPMDLARTLVVGIAEQAMVYAAAGATADDILLRGQAAGRQPVDFVVRTRMQELLNDLQSGIIIDTVSVERERPIPVYAAFDAITSAESEKANLIDAARLERNQILVEVAGSAALPREGRRGPLLRLIDDFQLAYDLEDEAEIARLNAILDDTFNNLSVTTDTGEEIRISGQVAQIINDALLYRTRVEQNYRAAATEFRELLEAYRESPNLFVAQYMQRARQEIFSGDVETMYAPDGWLLLDINRDPAIERQRERQRLQRERQERR